MHGGERAGLRARGRWRRRGPWTLSTVNAAAAAERSEPLAHTPPPHAAGALGGETSDACPIRGGRRLGRRLLVELEEQLVELLLARGRRCALTDVRLHNGT